MQQGVLSKVEERGRVSLAMVMSGSLWLSQAAQAQAPPEYRDLLFDPVALELTQPPPAQSDDETVATVREITRLPSEGAERLQSVLRRRDNERQRPGSGAVAAEPEADIARYEGNIRKLELEGGPYAANLVQELLDLGTAYQRVGQHPRAIGIFERASHINRVNSGLFNLEQVPIVDRMIESYLATGNLPAADQQQEYLFYIKQKAHGHDSADLLPALITLADWNIFAFNARLSTSAATTLAGETEAYASNVSNSIGSENFRTRRLVNAQNLYRASIQIIRRESGVADPRLLEAEKKLALTNYFFATNYNAGGNAFQDNSGFSVQSNGPLTALDIPLISGNSMGYRHGREALERRIRYLRAQPDAPTGEIARALTDLGDWLLVFKKRRSALDIYREAWQLLEESPGHEELITELFQPAIPVSLPTFVAPSYSRAVRDIPPDQALRYKGYLDMGLTLNRYGLPGDVEVLGRTPNANEYLESRLVRSLRRNQYRPRLSGGEPGDDDRIHLRYYFTY